MSELPERLTTDQELDGAGLMPVDTVPEVGEQRWGSVIGYCTVTSVVDSEDDFGPTKLITFDGQDGAAAGMLFAHEFNRAYPALRQSKERPAWLFAARRGAP